MHNEAVEGMRRGILVSAFLEDISPPFEFRRLQATNLVGCENQLRGNELGRFLEAISRVLGGDVSPFEYAKAQPSREKVAKKGRRSKKEDIWLSAASPEVVSPNTCFVARFAAYTSKYRGKVTATIESESPKSKLFLDLHSCQWEKGTKVTVCLSRRYDSVRLSSFISCNRFYLPCMGSRPKLNNPIYFYISGNMVDI